ncbi:probable peptidyl-tRNA hydrolase 2 [Aethina tumida]|uniref:probable peptidyl-tRNA hydrolase 2 n=1 Tax=Aethina tumida TaxID=116153 RepID=UPI0021488119|nr:probable peptidyl-tRNA hydrolase 2 [Aethina tumida]
MSAEEENFKPNLELLEQLLAIGILRPQAEEALFCTGNKSLNDAINFVFSEEPDDTSKHKGDGQSDESSDEEDQQYFKMTFIVNQSLKMGVGKVAAQVGHACLGLYRSMIEQNLEEMLHIWECNGEKKIVLRGDDAEHLQNLYEKSKSQNIPCYLVSDAGHTQIPSGSITVLSLFGQEDTVDKVAGKLKLL